MPFLELHHVSKSFAGRQVLRQVNLQVERGEFLAIVGFSGCGKTTLMSLLAGLTRPDSGQVLFNGSPVSGPAPERGIVFQNYSLLPWLTVYGNIALGVDQVFRSWPRAKRREHVLRFIEMVHLTHATHKRPGELSGGMRQRVALARTLAINPQALLLDEPLSALDALTRGTLQQEIARIWSEERTTCVMITNDIDEAILLADRIVPLTPAPAATLGPSFAVGLARPRNRTELNHDPQFKQLRNAVTTWLLDSRKQGRREVAGAHQVVTMPQLVPRTSQVAASRKSESRGQRRAVPSNSLLTSEV